MVRFIKRVRMQSLSLLARLSQHEYFFVEKMADFNIYEQTLSDDSGSVDNELDSRSDVDHFGSVNKVAQSNDLKSL